MIVLFYDDELIGLAGTPSIFLAGPTTRGSRTPWRMEAIKLLENRGYTGTVVIPEFRAEALTDNAPVRFGKGESPSPGMHIVPYNILQWETMGIEHSACALFWMPFTAPPGDHPGLTTRAEVSRELARKSYRLALGMPADTVSSNHIRYHAHQAHQQIHDTLEATVGYALTLIRCFHLYSRKI